MIRKRLAVLLIEDSPTFAEVVRQWLAEDDNIDFAITRADSLMAGLNILTKGGVDVILLDLVLPDSQGMATFSTAKMCALDVPIVILSSSDTEALALETVRLGAQDYIVKSTCNSQLLRKALKYALSRSSKEPSAKAVPDQGTVIGAIGSKGGVGVTSFACNLATELRRQTSQTTLLIDLDMDAGLVGLLMNTESGHSILDAVASISRLDASFWEGFVSRGPDGLDILRSPDLLGDGNAEASNIAHVLTLIQPMYRWTVLDLGRMNRLSRGLLDRLSELYLITTLTVPAIYQTKRTIGALKRAGFELDRLRILLSPVGKKQDLSETQLKQHFGAPVHAKLVAAGDELEEACVQGKLLELNSDYRGQIAGMARKIAGLGDEKSARSFGSMFRRSK